MKASRIMKSRNTVGRLCWLLALAGACGSGAPRGANTTPAGGTGAGTGAAPTGTGTGAAPVDAAPAEPPGPPAPYTFKLVNQAEQPLVFSLDHGWQPVIFGYSGKPPKAKPIVMFPKFCTAACEAPDAERCPVCEAPEKVADVKAAEKREVVAPGQALPVPWQGLVHVYQKTSAKPDGKKKVRCDCYKTQPVAEGSYTIKACGFRVTDKPNTPSRLQCVEGQLQVPAQTPAVIELVFPALPDPAAAGASAKPPRRR
jgi:hypothetical protein